MNIALDTNVIVSGLLNPFSPCGKIVRMVSAGELRLCLDARLLSEYSEVLARPRFKFDAELVSALLDHISHTGLLVAGSPLALPLPDPDDASFLEVALAGQAEHLVTGNLKHFPPHLRGGMSVISPRDFIDRYMQRGSKASKPERQDETD